MSHHGMSNPTLRLYEGLARASNSGHAAAYRVWEVANYLDRNGLFADLRANSQAFPKRVLVRGVARFLGMNYDAVERSVERDAGLFWDFRTTKNGVTEVKLRGAQAVAEGLGLDSPGRRYEVGVEDPTALRSARRWKSLCMGVCLPAKATRLARETVRDITGVSPDTQRRIEREGIASYDNGRGETPRDEAPGFLYFRTEIASPVASKELSEMGAPGFTPAGISKLRRQLPKNFQSQCNKSVKRSHQKRVTKPRPAQNVRAPFSAKGTRVHRDSGNVLWDGKENFILDASGREVSLAALVQARQARGLRGAGLCVRD